MLISFSWCDAKSDIIFYFDAIRKFFSKKLHQQMAEGGT